MGRDNRLTTLQVRQCSFNPHARVGRDGEPLWAERHNLVSIHTPVWGVTLRFATALQEWCVSIHTPVWGVTKEMQRITEQLAVSIHTPVWGVTYIIFAFIFITNCFNPHARVGRDSLCITVCQPTIVSIHTPVWGVTCFHSRQYRVALVSIHTPVWGVT